jgi:hypothetical protein
LIEGCFWKRINLIEAKKYLPDYYSPVLCPLQRDAQSGGKKEFVVKSCGEFGNLRHQSFPA